MKQTRFPSFGSPQRVRLDTASNPDTSTVPSRSGPSISDVMASIGAMRSEMGTLRSEMGSQFDDIRKEFHDLRADYAVLQSEVKDLKKDVTKLMIVNQDLQRENKDLFAKMTDYKAKLDDLEGRSKRNNLIFYGFPRIDGETSDDCEGLLRDLFVDKLDLTEDIELNRVHRLSSKPDSPIIARCAFYKQKVKILSQKRKLKGTQFFVGEDFSRRVRDLKKRLTPHLKKAREDGKRAVMVFNYLLIDSKKLSLARGATDLTRGEPCQDDVTDDVTEMRVSLGTSSASEQLFYPANQVTQSNRERKFSHYNPLGDDITSCITDTLHGVTHVHLHT
ncbi:hypothetical protein ACOMHN_022305 [Nucella lapillus]